MAVYSPSRAAVQVVLTAAKARVSRSRMSAASSRARRPGPARLVAAAGSLVWSAGTTACKPGEAGVGRIRSISGVALVALVAALPGGLAYAKGSKPVISGWAANPGTVGSGGP